MITHRFLPLMLMILISSATCIFGNKSTPVERTLNLTQDFLKSNTEAKPGDYTALIFFDQHNIPGLEIGSERVGTEFGKQPIPNKIKMVFRQVTAIVTGDISNQITFADFSTDISMPPTGDITIALTREGDKIIATVNGKKQTLALKPESGLVESIREAQQKDYQRDACKPITVTNGIATATPLKEHDLCTYKKVKIVDKCSYDKTSDESPYLSCWCDAAINRCFDINESVNGTCVKQKTEAYAGKFMCEKASK